MKYKYKNGMGNFFINEQEIIFNEDDKIGDSGIFGVDVFIIPPLLTVFCSVLGWFGWFGNLE